MKIKAFDLINLPAVVAHYASFTHFSDQDVNYDYQARRRAQALLKAVKEAAEPLIDMRNELLDKHCKPADAMNLRGYKMPEDRVVIETFDRTLHEIQLPTLEERDMHHPDVSGAMMELFENCGLIRVRE